MLNAGKREQPTANGAAFFGSKSESPADAALSRYLMGYTL